MPKIDGIHKVHKNISATTEEQKDAVIPSGKTWVIHGISFTAPARSDCRCKLIWDPAGGGPAPAKVYESAIHDKFVKPTSLAFEGDDTKKLRIQLENDHSAAHFMGCTVYYEEIG